jgi:AAA domain
VNVLYVPGEGRMAMSRRIDAWKLQFGYHLDDALGLYLWDGALPLLDPAQVRECIAEARAHRIGLVILDTWQRCLGADENSTQDVSAGVAAVDRIRDALGAAVLVIHHTGLATERERGNTALRASADTMLSLKDDDQLVLRLEKQRDGAQWPELVDRPFRLIPQVDAGSLVAVADDGEPVKGFSHSQLKAMAALRRFPVHEGATKTEWCESCAPMSRATFYRTAAKLVSHHVVSQAKSRYRFTATYRDSNGDGPEEHT